MTNFCWTRWLLSYWMPLKTGNHNKKPLSTTCIRKVRIFSSIKIFYLQVSCTAISMPRWTTLIILNQKYFTIPIPSRCIPINSNKIIQMNQRRGTTDWKVIHQNLTSESPQTSSNPKPVASDVSEKFWNPILTWYKINGSVHYKVSSTFVTCSYLNY